MAARALSWLGALILAAPAAAQSHPDRVYSLASATAAPPHRLALDLLGPERAADVVAVEVDDLGGLRQLGSVRFLHRPTPIGASFCGQRLHYVGFRALEEVPVGVPPEAIRASALPAVETVRVALAPGCRLAPDQSFVQVNPPATLAEAMAGLRGLAAARQAARGGGPLPFSLSCADETGRAACAAGGRAVLAGLAVERAWLFGLDGFVVGTPGRTGWVVRLVRFGTPEAQVMLTRRIPSPF